ncbi:DUF5686 and carboxypeptidase regulatory-like domain-containing protein [Chitinophaga pendula]|uniref:DUF5686 family protein n=1 Tax=Chitinophaga TaxID=79328 RepID=UPI000BB02715|nr:MULTISPECIES: DUF5686 family protein [Chitinophaga]ASZ12556.1 hypothetical protein CK934_17120 [Chitinophaga sp. MD30]UCJ09841.1 DUF5686 and carboxypeptidase regulatory-like domain-containing protein [Chitinophaga pendula]
MLNTCNCFIYRWLLCIVLLAASQGVIGQDLLTGKVIGQFTREPLPYATVYWKLAGFGVMTDSVGIFRLKKSHRTQDTLLTRYVGYNVRLTTGQALLQPEILIEMETLLKEGVEVKSKLNKGWVWWRQVVAHKEENAPSHYTHYYAELYNKLEVDLSNLNNSKWLRSGMMKPFAPLLHRIDSTTESQPFLPVFLSESISDYYSGGSPKRAREEIKALQTSGIKNESVMECLGGMNQKINTYDDYISIFGREFVSPVCRAGDRYYDYKGLDTVSLHGEHYYHLRFTPKREGENVFSGDCWIHSSTWALQKISMTVNGAVNINFVKRLDLIQEFSRLNDKEWYVSKDKFIVELSPLGKTRTSFIGRKTTHYRKVVINQPEIDSKLDVNNKKEEVIIADSAGVASSDYWLRQRPEPLGRNELNAITLVDTLKSMPAYKKLSTYATLLVEGYIKLGKVEIGPWYRWVSRNQVEGMRFRFDLGTTPKFSRRLRLFGYLAYGTRDESLKGKLAATYNYGNWSLLSSFKDDIDNRQRGFKGEEVALDNIFGQLIRRPDIQQKFIREREIKLSVMRRLAGSFSVQGTASNNSFTTFDPLPSHKLYVPQNLTQHAVVSTAFELKLRYAPGEREIRTFRKVRRLRSNQPIWEMAYTFAPSGVLGSHYTYQKLDVSVSHRFRIPAWGQVQYMVYGGKYFGNQLPFMLLQVHPGNETYYYNKEAFSLMNRYEFFSDRYAGINIEHHFDGKLLNLLPFMRRTGIRQFWNVKTVVGDLSEANRLYNRIHKAEYGMRSLGGNAYTELGTGLDNIFKFLRVDAVWRFYPNSSKVSRPSNFGIFGSFRLQF